MGAYSDAGISEFPDINQRKNIMTPYQNQQEILNYDSLDIDSSTIKNQKRKSVMTTSNVHLMNQMSPGLPPLSKIKSTKREANSEKREP